MASGYLAPRPFSHLAEELEWATRERFKHLGRVKKDEGEKKELRAAPSPGWPLQGRAALEGSPVLGRAAGGPLLLALPRPLLLALLLPPLLVLPLLGTSSSPAVAQGRGEGKGGPGGPRSPRPVAR